MFTGLFNYWVVIITMMSGLYIVMSSSHLVKKIIGLNIFQTAVFILFISMGKVSGGTAPILAEGITSYSNPLPHVLILTAIVVGVATTALGLAIAVRIYESYGTVDEIEIAAMDNADHEQEAAPKPVTDAES
ncbi:Na+/H+ antiporter subunit C [Chromatiales bacterium (ex Bugula neritina AB1)]|nr:Na+/H+ antiporter subunit C [Chromatiales bacterium (ex Bugula neritina AB1)]